MADTEPRAAAGEPVTNRDIAEFLRHLTRLRTPALGGDPAALAAFLAHKAELFTRIADQHADTDPKLANQARQAAERARADATRHAENTAAQDRTNVNDLTSPSSPRWGISLSNTAEFRRASSTASSSAIKPSTQGSLTGAKLKACRE
jgi:hypothetical protein